MSKVPLPKQPAALQSPIRTGPLCCEPICMEPTFCPAGDIGGRFADRDKASGPWMSPDRKLRAKGVRYLQVGGDTWNRCGPGWLNLDGNFDRGDGLPGGYVWPNTIFVDDTDRYNMKHVVSASSRLPFADASVQFVYTEHMMEHMLPLTGGGVNFLREAWRVLAPGGLLRIVTPDLAKYVCALAGRGPPGSVENGFLEKHAARFGPMEMMSNPPTRATITNNIFRNYGHEWIYDYEELRHALRYAGVDPKLACRSDRAGRGIPRWARLAIRRANQPHNETQQCWLDQEVREGESMYVNVLKPLV